MCFPLLSEDVQCHLCLVMVIRVNIFSQPSLHNFQYYPRFMSQFLYGLGLPIATCIPTKCWTRNPRDSIAKFGLFWFWLFYFNREEQPNRPFQGNSSSLTHHFFPHYESATLFTISFILSASLWSRKNLNQGLQHSPFCLTKAAFRSSSAWVRRKVPLKQCCKEQFFLSAVSTATNAC